MSDEENLREGEEISGNAPVRGARLSVTATPIGNLSDLSPRARETLAAADFIACEDTRTTGNLLRRFGIARPLLAYHEHNEQASAAGIAAKIAAGAHVALVCDAGTPTLSDPGFRVVRECRRAGLAVESVPGPCALIAALSVSGLPTNAFAFHGFLPPKSAARRRFLEENRAAKMTLAVYESCHRIRAFAEEIAETRLLRARADETSRNRAHGNDRRGAPAPCREKSQRRIRRADRAGKLRALNVPARLSSFEKNVSK